MRWLLPAMSIFLCAAGNEAFAQYGPVQEGHNLVLRLCATCHAIGSAERSPNAAAPTFRHIEARIDLNELAKRLHEGIIVGHPEMPAFILKEHEARALVAYLRSIQADRPR